MPLLALAPDVEMVPDGLRRAGAVTRLSDVMTVAALATGIPSADLAGGPADGPRPRLLDGLHRRQLLCWRVEGIAEAAPLAPGLGLPDVSRRDSPGGPVPLSRFALLRRDDAGWLLESGRSAWLVRLTDRGVAGLGDLALLGEGAGALLGLLAAAGMLAERDGDPAALAWEPHDRYFASRSRGGPLPAASYRLAALGPPLPAAREDEAEGERIPLPVPAGPGPDEPSLWVASEARRSVREFAERPVPLEALGALLWRTLRVVRLLPRDPSGANSYEAMLRPVSSGGAMHATDLWLVCTSVADVPPGVWRYDPFAHALVGVPLADGGGRLNGFLSAVGSKPPVLGLLTVRHARTAWKYSGIAYSLELKDVGVILHALNLTAGAVGLGMCAWGSGPTAEIARLLGVDPEVDSPAGEFVVGVPR